MDHFEKFLRQLSPKLRDQVVAVALKIGAGDLHGLNVKKLQGRQMYRCRVGDIRIIFAKTDGGRFWIVDADFRGNAYKK